MSQADIGLIGLAVMGENLVLNMESRGFTVAVYNRTVAKVDAGLIGQAALQLGAGRAKANDGVDAAVGFDRLVKVGETVHAGHPLCRIHARSAVDFDMAEAMLGMAVKIAAH